MPRIARLDTPGLLHHVMTIGIEGRKIFNDDTDRENFIERLSALIPETRTECYAWSFLSNHAHFLLRSGPGGIAALMRRLLTGHAVYYNRRYKRHGQLFQNRYKSIICQEDAYLLELVRYIHLNPLSDVLAKSEREFSRKYRLKSLGYDFEKVLRRVSTLFDLEKGYITGKGRQRDRVRARDLLCY